MEGSFPSSEDFHDLDASLRRHGRRGASRLVFYGLIAFLVVVFVGSLGTLGVGIWTLEAEYGSRQLSTLVGVTLYAVDSYMLVICSACIIFITLLGSCGVYFQYRCLMGLHLGLLAFMSVMLFMAGVLGYVLINELEAKVRDTLEKAIVEQYGTKGATEITAAWDRIQSSFSCCGVYGNLNSTTSWALYKERSKWFTEDISNGSYVPASCCGDKNKELCLGLVEVPGAPPRTGPPVDVVLSDLNYTLHTQGCFDVLDPYLRATGASIGTVANRGGHLHAGGTSAFHLLLPQSASVRTGTGSLHGAVESTKVSQQRVL